MARTKSLEPIEEYMEARCKDGFSHEEVLKALQKRGYDGGIIELARKTHQYRTQMKWLVGVCILLAAAVVGMGVLSLRHQAVVGSPQCQPVGQVVGLSKQQALNAKAGGCLSVADDAKRRSCLAAVQPLLEDSVARRMSQEGIGLENPEYADVAASVGFLSAIKNDDSGCRRLGEPFSKSCKASMPLIRASMEGDEALCNAAGDMQVRQACILEIVGRKDPVQVQNLINQEAQVIVDAVQKSDEGQCQALPFDAFKENCRIAVKIRHAVQSESRQECEGIGDVGQRVACLNMLVQALQAAGKSR